MEKEEKKINKKMKWSQCLPNIRTILKRHIHWLARRVLGHSKTLFIWHICHAVCFSDVYSFVSAFFFFGLAPIFLNVVHGSKMTAPYSVIDLKSVSDIFKVFRNLCGKCCGCFLFLLTDPMVALAFVALFPIWFYYSSPSDICKPKYCVFPPAVICGHQMCKICKY